MSDKMKTAENSEADIVPVFAVFEEILLLYTLTWMY